VVGGTKNHAPLAIKAPCHYNWRFVAAGVAQLVEHLICNQRVGGSNPFASSRLSEEEKAACRLKRRKMSSAGETELQAGVRKLSLSLRDAHGTRRHSNLNCRWWRPPLVEFGGVGKAGTGTPGDCEQVSLGQVAERSMAAGCKPAAPCELRGFESSPVHHENSAKWSVASGKKPDPGDWLRSWAATLLHALGLVVELPLTTVLEGRE
jgi:hypothetical protein